MKIVMTMVVRNEEDILATNIDYHKSRGVDYFLVIDHLSTDSTSEILQKYQREGILEYFRENDPAFRQGKWVTQMARRAADEHSADWVINSDADEFWWPEGDASFKEILENVPKEVEYLNVETGLFVYLADCKEDFLSQMTSRRVGSFKNGNYKKTIHRAFSDIRVAEGNHKVWRTKPVRSLVAGTAPFLILRFPIRRLEQIKLKILNGVEARNKVEELEGRNSGHWRKIHEKILSGNFDQWGDDLIAENELMDKDPKKIVHDYRLRDYMLDLKREGRITVHYQSISLNSDVL